ncbi:hypothetical protein EDD85DRAFT_791018 [Armillaria nabsnona]|nr:hypothetical protein EDD85DRAFT_791018 [Armillaria nabsnona]
MYTTSASIVLTLELNIGDCIDDLDTCFICALPITEHITAALEQFQMLTFMGKISAYKYYHSLAHLTDNTVCKWSFIHLLKRAGIGNNHSGWKAAKPGSCAVECLACPQPGINIPEHVDPDGPNAWEDTLFKILSEDKDPGLSKGLAYFVDTETFHKHLKDFDKQIIQPPSTCSNHEATKVDLHVSEIQVKMVFGYLTPVRHFAGVPCIVTSYDIIPKKVYLVPKFHLPGHIKDCQEKYCMSFHIHVGTNDGEAPERSWAISNAVAASMREMGPGHQCEKLNQHFGDFNWQKNVSQGDTLLHKIKDAMPEASEHEDHFKCFTASLPQSDVAKWTKMVEDWEVDRNKPNPFAQTIATREDAQNEIASLDGDELHTTSLKDMISQGIQLKSSQYMFENIL